MDISAPAKEKNPPCLPPIGLRALATDFDGTLAHDGKVSETAPQGMMRLKEADFRLIMVTGRELNDLVVTFPQIGVFDLLVLENGAVLYEPATGNTQALAAGVHHAVD